MDAFLEFLKTAALVVLPSLLTVTLGSLVAQRYFVKRANQALLIDSILNELRELRVLALEYWAMDGEEKKNAPRLIALSSQIKALLRSISADVTYICTHYKSPAGLTTELSNLVLNVHDACTGGAFESAKKPVDSGRCLVISNGINNLKSTLRKLKL
jgi:hypothetical protein